MILVLKNNDIFLINKCLHFESIFNEKAKKSIKHRLFIIILVIIY